MRNYINKLKGFTLIELMITVAIISILAAVAYPAYQDSIRKTRRANAQSDLVSGANWMERFYTQNGRYDQDSGGTDVSLPASLSQSPVEGTAYYNIALNGSVSVSAFTLRATPVVGLGQDGDGYMEITQSGAKTWDRNDDDDTLDADETNWNR